MATMKIVVRLDMLHCDRQKQKAIKTVSTLCGIDEILVDTKDGKMTVVGTVDPFDVVRKLRKRFCMAEMVSVAPAKEEKKNVNKEDDKTDGNKEKASSGGDKKGENTKGACTPIPVCQPCYPPHWYPQPCYLVHAEEHPYTCVIC